MEDASREGKGREQSKSEMKSEKEKRKSQKITTSSFIILTNISQRVRSQTKVFFISVLSSVPKSTNIWSENKKTFKAKNRNGKKVKCVMSLSTFLTFAIRFISKYLFLASCIPSCNVFWLSSQWTTFLPKLILSFFSSTWQGDHLEYASIWRKVQPSKACRLPWEESGWGGWWWKENRSFSGNIIILQTKTRVLLLDEIKLLPK